MLTWLIVIICLFVLPLALQAILMFVVTPILIHGRQTLPLKPDYHETRAEDLSPEMQDFLSAALKEFAAHGFHVAANVHQPSVMKNTTASQMLLVNRESGDTATAIMVHAAGIRSLVFVVTSRFRDLSAISTGAARSISYLPQDPKTQSVNFPWVTSPSALIEVHRRRLTALARLAEPRVAPIAGEEFTYLQKQWDREIERMVNCGYTYADQTSGLCRMTWKGAILAACKLAKPVKRIRLQWRERKSRRLWNQLGMDTWSPASIPHVDAHAAVDSTSIVDRADPSDRGDLDNGSLTYEAALRFGEIRKQFTKGFLLIRMGGLTRSQAIVARWTGILSIGWWTACATASLVNIWLLQRAGGRSAALLLFDRSWILLTMCAGFILYEAYRLFRALNRARGTIVVSVNHSGVRFRNVPGIADGHVPRTEIESVNVVVHEGLIRRIYRLEIRLSGTVRAQPLFFGPDKSALAELAQEIRQAMGTELLRTVPPPLPV